MVFIKRQPNAVSGWQALVKESQKKLHISLEEEIEVYLIRVLDKYMNQVDVLTKTLGIDYLESMLIKEKVARSAAFCEVGDTCLLYAGCFPERATRLNVPVSYFVDLGRKAYQQLADLSRDKSLSRLYFGLSEQFVLLVDVLLCMYDRHISDHISLFQANFLWHRSGSFYAKQIVQRLSGPQGSPFG